METRTAEQEVGGSAEGHQPSPGNRGGPRGATGARDRTVGAGLGLGTQPRVVSDGGSDSAGEPTCGSLTETSVLQRFLDTPEPVLRFGETRGDRNRHSTLPPLPRADRLDTTPNLHVRRVEYLF